ncbi:MAG: hypothetical protein DYG90_13545 [Chloroflexi bacterium CFX6]|nr:hypothetical protein [Chloroflexi bacterium CFX6]
MYMLLHFPNAPEAAPINGETGPDPEQVEPFADAEGHAVELTFEGANEGVRIVSSGELPGDYNWLVGDIDVDGAKAYRQITYEDLYDGIDLIYGGSAEDTRIVKSLYRVDPGVDPSAIVMKYAGHDGLSVDENFNLVIATPLGNIVERAPFAFQMAGGTMEPVSAALATPPTTTST